MLFNSFPFLLLVIITFLIYYCPLFKNQQVLVLITASIIFYGYSQPYYLLLLLISASINAIASYLVFYADTQSHRKVSAIAGVVINLAILIFFKYNHLLDEIVSPAHDLFYFMVTLPLPIGISFYTFQGISLVIDTYDPEKIYDLKVEKKFSTHYKNTVFFIIFFPQLIAGPIVKAHQFIPQISRKYIKNINVSGAFKSIVIGYFLKSVIADNLKDQTFWIAYPYFEFQSSLTLITMLFGFSMQIFADFAGYSLIAIGVAEIYGYKLMENFNFPYISASIAEFWRRWHISLSSWLKEYLYFNLGGNKKGNLRTYLNLIIVMFLGGLWHGAALNYGIWGLWHGTGLMIERALTSKVERNKEEKRILLLVLRILFVFLFVSMGWLLFKLTSMRYALDYLLAIFKNVSAPHNYALLLKIAIYSSPVLIYHIMYLIKTKKVELYNTIVKHDYLIYSVMIMLIIVNGGIPGEFIYFQF
jgi:alginate O-acetyltransferase complex protein AlgI